MSWFGGVSPAFTDGPLLITCKMSNVNEPREAWSAETLVPRPHETGIHPDSTGTVHIRTIQTKPDEAAYLREISYWLMCHFVRRDGKCGVIDFSCKSYCAHAAKILYKYHSMLLKPEKRQKISNTFKRIWPWTEHTSSHLLWKVEENCSQSPRNIQEDLQSYHPINGQKWVF